jgi:hypothetical protein
VTVTPQELQSRALCASLYVGALPDSAWEQAQWRERRDDAAVQLATAADGDTGLVSQAASLCDRDDNPAKELLLEALGYCPRKNR